MAGEPKQFGGYWLVRQLGAGGGGDVHLARRLERGSGPTSLVVKRLHPSLADRKEYLARFAHEAELATYVDNHHVAKVYEAGSVGDVPFIALEHVVGWPLNKVMERLLANKVTTPLSAAIDLVCGALVGLGALHSAKKDGVELGIIHRDIAPKNIMLRGDGTACLIDLGIGKSRAAEWKTATGVVLGSPGYMAPEYVVAKPIDHRADLFAMAIVLWELIALRRFVPGETPHQRLLAGAVAKYVPLASVRPGVPTALDQVLERALARDPEARYSSAAALTEAVRATIDVRETSRWFVEQMPADELGREETEVRAVEAMPLPEAAPPSVDDVDAPLETLTIYASKLRAVTVRKRRFEKRLAAMVAALALGPAALVFFVFSEERAAPVVATEPSAPPIDRIVVRQRPAEPEPAIEETPPPPPRKLRPTKAAVVVPREEPPREEPPREEPPREESPREEPATRAVLGRTASTRVADMIRVVRDIQKSDPQNSDAAALLNALIRLRASGDLDAQLERIEALENRVDALR